MSIWYVRPISGEYGAEDGTTYATAYDGFAGITWGAGGVVAGDTLYVCGEHTETMTVGASGSDGSPITIRGDYSSDAGSINGETTRTIGIDTAEEDYLVFDGLEIYGHEHPSDPDNNEDMGIKVNDSDGVVIQNSSFHDGNWQGVKVQDGDGAIIQNNTFTAFGSRGILAFSREAGTITNCTIRNNTITACGRWAISLDSQNTVDRNANATGFRIYGNTINGNGGGIAFEDIGETLFYNNDIGENLLTGADPRNGESGRVFQIQSAKDLRIVNNTLNLSTDESTNSGTPCDIIRFSLSPGGIVSDNIKILGNVIDVVQGDLNNGPLIISAQASSLVTKGVYAGNRAYRTNGILSGDNEWKIYNNIFRHSRYFSRFNQATMSSLSVKNNVFHQFEEQTHPEDTQGLTFFSGDTPELGGNVYISKFSNVVVGYDSDNWTVAELQSGPEPTALDTDPAFDDDGNVTEVTLLDSGVPTDEYETVGIDGEPFSTIDRSRGSTQATDASLNPFHPLNL